MNTPVFRFPIRARLVHLVTLGRKRVERAAQKLTQGFVAPSSLSPRMLTPASEHVL